MAKETLEEMKLVWNRFIFLITNNLKTHKLFGIPVLCINAVGNKTSAGFVFIM